MQPQSKQSDPAIPIVMCVLGVAILLLLGVSLVQNTSAMLARPTYAQSTLSTADLHNAQQRLDNVYQARSLALQKEGSDLFIQQLQADQALRQQADQQQQQLQQLYQAEQQQQRAHGWP